MPPRKELSVDRLIFEDENLQGGFGFMVYRATSFAAATVLWFGVERTFLLLWDHLLDRCANVLGQRRISVGFLEGVEFPVLDVAQSWSETLCQSGEQREDMIAGAASIGEQFLDFEDCVVVEQAVEDIDGLAFGRADYWSESPL